MQRDISATDHAPTYNRAQGLAAAFGVLVIWSCFIVFSRAGVKTELTPGDITALRFLVAGALTLPFAWAWWPHHLKPTPFVIMALCGSGALYSMLLFIGLSETSAAYAGVFTNGALPFFTLMIVIAITRVLPNRLQVLSLVIITTGAVVVAVAGIEGQEANVLRGIAFFLTAAAIQSLYIFGVRYWNISPYQALVIINIPNAVVFLPLWYFFLPSGLAEADTSTVVFQALFQGMGPGFIAVILFAMAAKQLGPNATAGFSAAVPASATLLAIPVLAEIPQPIEWTGIALVTVGLLLLVRAR